MSEIAIHQPTDAGAGAFNARTMLLITAIGTLAFIAMLVLGAYAPDLRSGHNGGSHALSNAATGLSGLARHAHRFAQVGHGARSAEDRVGSGVRLAACERSGADALSGGSVRDHARKDAGRVAARRRSGCRAARPSIRCAADRADRQ